MPYVAAKNAKDGRGRAGTQQFVIGVIDPSSKWAHAEIFQRKAPTQEQSMQAVVNALKLLRDGYVGRARSREVSQVRAKLDQIALKVGN